MTDKPTAVVIREAKENIIHSINEQGIDLSVMKYIVKEIYEMVCEAADKEYENGIAMLNARSAEDKQDGEAIQQDNLEE